MHAKWFLFSLCLAVALFGCASAPTAPIKQHLTILHFNDLRGHLQPHPAPGTDQPLGGVARLTTLVNRIRKQNDAHNIPTLLFYSGGFLSGSPVADEYRGEATLRVLNVLGIDGTTVAADDLKFGRKHFDKLVDEAKFPWLVTHLREKDKNYPWLPLGFGRRLATGLIIGVVGVTDMTLLENTPRIDRRDLAIDDPVLPTQVALVRSGGTGAVNVILSQCGLECNKRLAREITSVDVILAGGDRQLYREPIMENGVPILQAGARGEYLGRLDLERVGSEVRIVRYKVYPITPDLAEDRIVKSLADGFVNRLKQKKN